VRLWAGTLGAGQQLVVFTVPTGQRVVVKSLEVSQVGSTTAGVRLRINGKAGILIRVPTPAGSIATHWYGHQVLHEGEAANCIADGAAADIGISGYLLTGAGGPLTPSLSLEVETRPAGLV